MQKEKRKCKKVQMKQPGHNAKEKKNAKKEEKEEKKCSQVIMQKEKRKCRKRQMKQICDLVIMQKHRYFCYHGSTLPTTTKNKNEDLTEKIFLNIKHEIFKTC